MGKKDGIYYSRYKLIKDHPSDWKDFELIRCYNNNILKSYYKHKSLVSYRLRIKLNEDRVRFHFKTMLKFATLNDCYDYHNTFRGDDFDESYKAYCLLCITKNIHISAHETIKHKLQTKIHSIIKKCLIPYNDFYIDDFSCSLNEFKKYFEERFKDNMTWNNYGEWHVDHINPCVGFDLVKEDEQKKCFNLLNFNPLWKIENIKKQCRGLGYPRCSGHIFRDTINYCLWNTPADFESCYEYLNKLFEEQHPLYFYVHD
jgi:hypothetical protein